jgi:hypothetical protein
MLCLSPLLTLLLFVSLGCGVGETGGKSTPPGLRADPAPLDNRKLVDKNRDKNCPNGTNLNYEGFAEPLLLEHCTSCHSQDLVEADRLGTPEGLNFDSLEGVQTWQVRILAVLSGKKIHSFYGNTMDSRDQSSLVLWLNCGAPGS